MKRKIQAVLFDLDGVLAETRYLHFEALSRALDDLGIYLSHEEHESLYDGLPTYKKVEIFRQKYNLTDDQVRVLNQKKQDYTVELLKDKIKPNEIHLSIFNFLRSQNIKIAVCSNTKRGTLDFILKNLAVDNLLEFSLSNEDVKDPKPSPEIYLSAMDRLKIAPENTVIFEDSPHGLIAARESKARVKKIKNSHELTLDLIKKLVS